MRTGSAGPRGMTLFAAGNTPAIQALCPPCYPAPQGGLVSQRPAQATLTVVMTNMSVLGLMYVWGWHLGAIEGMSITSLVGLSVDFCIHLCEGYVHGKAQDRFGKARYVVLPDYLHWG